MDLRLVRIVIQTKKKLEEQNRRFISMNKFGKYVCESMRRVSYTTDVIQSYSVYFNELDVDFWSTQIAR